MPDKDLGPPLVALVVGSQGAYAVGPGLDEAWSLGDLVRRFQETTARVGPRWVVWSAASTLRRVVDGGVDVSRTWDLAEAHRLVHGGWWATPGHVVAGCRGLDEADVPAARTPRLSGFDGDLFDVAAVSKDTSSPAAGHLRADALTWATDDARLRELAVLALECQTSQRQALGRIGGSHVGRRGATAARRRGLSTHPVRT